MQIWVPFKKFREIVESQDFFVAEFFREINLAKSINSKSDNFDIFKL